MRDSNLLMVVLIIVTGITSCSKNPYRSTNKVYKKTGKGICQNNQAIPH